MEIQKAMYSDQIFDDIVSKVRSGEIRPGDKFTIRSVSEQYRISSSPARDAISKLVEFGFLTPSQGGASYVIKMGKEEISQLLDINEFLTDVSFSLMCRNKMYDAVKHEMRAAYEKELEVKDRSAKERLQTFLQFANIVGQNTGNMFYGENIMKTLYGKATVAFGDYTQWLDPDEVLENSRQTTEAAESGDWEAVGKLRMFMVTALRKHLDALN